MANWDIVPLGKILNRVQRFEEKKDLQIYQFAGTYSYARGIFIGEKREGSTFRLAKIQRIHKDDFIYCKIMAWEGAFGVASDLVDDCVVSGAFVVYEIDRKRVEPKFIEYYFKQQSIWKSIGSQSTGTNVRRRSLHPNQFEEVLISIPSLSEQCRIVARIEELSGSVVEAQSLRKAATEETQSLLNATLSLLTQNLLTSHQPKRLEELTLFISDMNHEMPIGQDEGIPFISPRDFKENGGIDFVNSKKINREDYERLSKKARPQKGDILMARYGTIGAIRFVETDMEFLASYSVAVIRPDPKIVDGRFLFWMSKSPYVQEQAIKGIRGSGMADVGLNTIRRFSIPQMSLSEQRSLVEYLDNLQTKVYMLQGKQAESARDLDALMPAILDKAFKGEL